VISYNLYWVVVIAGFLFLSWKENKETVSTDADEGISETSSEHKELTGKKGNETGGHVATAVREIE
jgi:high-affinity iron transporter